MIGPIVGLTSSTTEGRAGPQIAASVASDDPVYRGLEARHLDDAAEVRERLGLRSDAAYVEAVARARETFNPIVQIPLTAAEAADIQRRERAMDAFEDVRAAAIHLPEFGGVYMDQSAGGVAVVVSSQVSDDLRAAVASALPKDARYEFRAGINSWAELKATERAVMNATRTLREPVGGLVVDFVAISPKGNVVTVGAERFSDAGAATDQLARALGVPASTISLKPAPNFQTQISRYTHSGRLYGGQRIWRTSAEGCSATGSAFVHNTNYWLVTAGHCGSTTSWRQGVWADPSPIGPSTGWVNGWDYGGAVVGSTYCDCQVIGPILGRETNDTLDAWNNVQNEYAMPTASLYEAGRWVCVSGATRNSVECEEIDNPSANYNLAYGAGGTVTMLDQFTTYLETCHGDSGGAVTVGNTWAGIHSVGASPPEWYTSWPGSDVPTATCTSFEGATKLTYNNLYWYLRMDGMKTWD